MCLAQFTCVNKFPILKTLNENYSNKQDMKVSTKHRKDKEYKIPGKFCYNNTLAITGYGEALCTVVLGHSIKFSQIQTLAENTRELKRKLLLQLIYSQGKRGVFIHSDNSSVQLSEQKNLIFLHNNISYRTEKKFHRGYDQGFHFHSVYCIFGVLFNFHIDLSIEDTILKYCEID